MRRGLLVLLGIVCWIGVAGNAASETSGNGDGTDVYTLGEIVVTENRPAVEAVATQWEVTAADIARSNAKTLDKALKLLPGVYVSSRAQGIPRVDIRGMRSRHVVLLLNGIPINSTSDGQFNPAIIGTDNIARIKVSYGGSSVLYGQGALGGVINIITKKGRKGFRGSLSAEADEQGTKTGRMNLSGGTEAVDLFVSTSVEDSDGYGMSSGFTQTPLEDGDVRNNSDRKRQNLFANTGYTINDDWQIGVTAEASSGEFGSPPAAVDNTADPVFGKKAKYARTEDYEGSSAQFSAAFDPDGPFGLRGWLFYNEYEEESAEYDGATYSTFKKKGNYYTYDKTKITGANLQGTYDFGAMGRLSGSLASEQDRFDSVGKTASGNNTGLNTPYDDDYEIDMHSLALEYSLCLFSKLDLALGYSHHWQERELGDNDDEGGALLGVHYRISDETGLRASASRKIRFPSLSQLYAVGEGNTGLEPERSMNYEIGVTQQLPWGIEADLAGFLNEVENYIEKDAGGVNQNNDEYRFQGVELNLRKAFLATGVVKVGYSYLDSENRSQGALADVLQYRPKHKVAVECNYEWDMGLSAYAGFMHVAEQYYTSGALAEKLADYNLVDVKVEQRFIADRLYGYIGATNLFDEDYEESYGFPQTGRTAYAGLKLVF